jgi:CRP/FNR family transcriptional regulator, cyclic AMP receptor protein
VRGLDELIAAAPLFEGLDRSHLQVIAGCGANQRFAAGNLLFAEGDPAERFFLIRRGLVALEVHVPGGGPLLVETLSEGEVIGWSWLFEPFRWGFDARAREDTRVVTFDGACLRGKAEADHELGYQLMRRFAHALTEHLEATRMQLLDVYGHTGDVRVD